VRLESAPDAIVAVIAIAVGVKGLRQQVPTSNDRPSPLGQPRHRLKIVNGSSVPEGRHKGSVLTSRKVKKRNVRLGDQYSTAEARVANTSMLQSSAKKRRSTFRSVRPPLSNTSTGTKAGRRKF
jgi:hypothetical protein